MKKKILFCLHVIYLYLNFSYKGDHEITDDDDHIEIVREKSHLGFYEMVLTNVTQADAGEYRCVASNKYSDESCSCIINVVSEYITNVPNIVTLKSSKMNVPLRS